MQIYERIKELRKLLDMTQEEFAEKINISRSNLGNIETNRIAITDRIIKDICDCYGANEVWLRTGEGSPLVLKDKYLLEQIKKLFSLDELDIEIIDTYINLPLQHRELFRNYIKLIVDHENKAYESFLETNYPHIFNEPMDSTDKDEAEFMGLARKEYRKEKKRNRNHKYLLRKNPTRFKSVALLGK